MCARVISSSFCVSAARPDRGCRRVSCRRRRPFSFGRANVPATTTRPKATRIRFRNPATGSRRRRRRRSSSSRSHRRRRRRHSSRRRRRRRRRVSSAAATSTTSSSAPRPRLYSTGPLDDRRHRRRSAPPLPPPPTLLNRSTPFYYRRRLSNKAVLRARTERDFCVFSAFINWYANSVQTGRYCTRVG